MYTSKAYMMRSLCPSAFESMGVSFTDCQCLVTDVIQDKQNKQFTYSVYIVTRSPGHYNNGLYLIDCPYKSATSVTIEHIATRYTSLYKYDQVQYSIEEHHFTPTDYIVEWTQDDEHQNQTIVKVHKNSQEELWKPPKGDLHVWMKVVTQEICPDLEKYKCSFDKATGTYTVDHASLHAHFVTKESVSHIHNFPMEWIADIRRMVIQNVRESFDSVDVMSASTASTASKDGRKKYECSFHSKNNQEFYWDIPDNDLIGDHRNVSIFFNITVKNKSNDE